MKAFKNDYSNSLEYTTDRDVALMLCLMYDRKDNNKRPICSISLDIINSYFLKRNILELEYDMDEMFKNKTVEIGVGNRSCTYEQTPIAQEKELNRKGFFFLPLLVDQMKTQNTDFQYFQGIKATDKILSYEPKNNIDTYKILTSNYEDIKNSIKSISDLSEVDWLLLKLFNPDIKLIDFINIDEYIFIAEYYSQIVKQFSTPETIYFQAELIKLPLMRFGDNDQSDLAKVHELIKENFNASREDNNSLLLEMEYNSECQNESLEVIIMYNGFINAYNLLSEDAKKNIYKRINGNTRDLHKISA